MHQTFLLLSVESETDFFISAEKICSGSSQDTLEATMANNVERERQLISLDAERTNIILIKKIKHS